MKNWNYFSGQTLRGRYHGRIVWAGTVIWNNGEYRDVFYANQALPRPTRESTVSPQNCRFLETKTKSCLFCFQSGLGPPSLPFQSKIACRRHLVVSRQERGHKMMLNCFSKEFYKVVMMIMQNGILRRLVESLECKMVSGVTCTGRPWEYSVRDTLLCYISPDVEIRSSVVGLLNTLLGARVVESFYMSPAAPQADRLTREYSMRAWEAGF